MNRPSESDPLDVLRAANPVRDDELPSASLARIRARVSEDVMTTKTMGRAKPARLAGLGIGVAAAAALALVLLMGGRGAAPGVAPGSPDGTPGGVAASNGPISASCVEQYSAESLAKRDFAFDGTVTAISGDKATFAVNRGFRGVSGETVTLDAPGMTGTSITSAGGPGLNVGDRYLVAGDSTFVWACGFTQPYAEALAAEWAATLGS